MTPPHFCINVYNQTNVTVLVMYNLIVYFPKTISSVLIVLVLSNTFQFCLCIRLYVSLSPFHLYYLTFSDYTGSFSHNNDMKLELHEVLNHRSYQSEFFHDIQQTEDVTVFLKVHSDRGCKPFFKN